MSLSYSPFLSFLWCYSLCKMVIFRLFKILSFSEYCLFLPAAFFTRSKSSLVLELFFACFLLFVLWTSAQNWPCLTILPFCRLCKMAIFFPELHKETTLKKLWTFAVVNAIFATVSGFITQLVRASHRYHEVTGSNPVELLNFSGSYTQLQILRSQLRGFHFRSSIHDACVSYIKETFFFQLCNFLYFSLSFKTCSKNIFLR